VTTPRYDVVVVGGGPAGAVAARYAALGGARTLLVERRARPGVPVQCGEFLPDTNELRRMFPRAGSAISLFEEARPFARNATRRLRVYSPGGRSYDMPLPGFVVDRVSLEMHLCAAAIDAGADMWLSTRAVTVSDDEVVTSRGAVRADVVVGADGPKSVVARDAGFAPQRHVAFGAEYLVHMPALPADRVDMYFGGVAQGGYAWVIPKGGGLANVGIGVRPPARRASRRREVLDPFLRKLETALGVKAEIVRFMAGLIPVDGPRRESVRGRSLLAGDAAGHLMPCNGGGIPTALICGRAAGEAAARHVTDGAPLKDYERRWRRAIGRELAHAVTIRRIFDVVTRSETATELAMCAAGPRGILDLMRCRPWYAGGVRA
jgi:digeranylgeranylglycerophospholipid reductase